MHASEMLEQCRNARKNVENKNEFTRIQGWNTVEMHASEMLEHSRNALLEHNTASKEILEYSRNACKTV